MRLAEFEPTTINLESAYFDAYYNRGIVYYQLKNYGAAFADFTTIIELEMPNIVQALNMRAVIFSIQGNYNSALDDLNAAIEWDPEYFSTYYKRAILYRRLGRRSEAVADLKRYLELETDTTSREEAEKQLYSLGNWEDNLQTPEYVMHDRLHLIVSMLLKFNVFVK